MAKDFHIGIGEHCAAAGSHICHVGNRSSGTRIAADIIATGLAGDERCLLVGDDPFVQPVLRHLRSRKVDVQAALKQHRLVRLHGQETGIELLGSIVSHLENEPPAGVRLVGHPNWNKRGWPTIGDLFAFETLIDQVARNYNAVFFCFFDHAAAPAEAIQAHPKAVAGKEIVENPGYMAPAEMRHRLRLSFAGK